MTTKFHQPVLLNEAIQFLKVQKGKRYIDTTIGGGGHAQAIIDQGGLLLGIDCDPQAVAYTQKRLSSVCPAMHRLVHGPDAFVRVVKANFADLKKIADQFGFSSVDGILFDLGVSSFQLETASRGFSFRQNGPLDMRMDPEMSVSAADLVNALSRKELYELFIRLGEEKRARTIADALVRARRLRKITTTQELANISIAVYGGQEKIGHLHPATKVFQALRIAVNDELNNLKSALPEAAKLLEKKGRLAVISFHSLEDRIVKNFFKEMEKRGEFTILTMKPITPNKEEIIENVRSRSAKLRIMERKTRIKD